MTKQDKKTVAASKTETPTQTKMENTALMVVKKKMSIHEKLDKIQSFDAIHGKYDYLTERKKQLDSFGKSQNGFNKCVMILEDDDNNEVKISNPAIIQELTSIAGMRLKEAIIKTEKEIEEFEV